MFTHSGWREIDGTFAYLHAGGAIGADAARSDVAVEPGLHDATRNGRPAVAMPYLSEAGAVIYERHRVSLDGAVKIKIAQGHSADPVRPPPARRGAGARLRCDR